MNFFDILLTICIPSIYSYVPLNPIHSCVVVVVVVVV